MKRVLAALLLSGAALAEAPPFAHERRVVPEGRGPQALAVDVPLLTGAASRRLEDLRLHDASGREVPWLLVPPEDAAPVWHPAARILPIAATKETSGFEADLGEPRLVDRLRLEGLGAPFLKRYRLEGSGDRSRFTLLVPDGTLFDLPGEKLKLLEAGFPASELRYLRVTWDDRRSARPRMPAGVLARSASPRAAPPAEKVSVSAQRRESEPGKSRFAIRLPGPRLPIRAVEIRVAEGPLLRPARVLESRLKEGVLEPVTLGEATLRRAVRDGESAADLSIPVREPEGTELELVVDDGDNPPLELEGVALDLGALPWIYFESASGEPLTARFGAPALRAPRYDLEAKRAQVSRAKAATARWGERGFGTAAAATASAPLPPAGAKVDVMRFEYRRTVEAGEAGLVTLPLDAAVLAHSRDLSDVRVVDAQGRQVPYLLEKRDEPLSLELPALAPQPADEERPAVSRYALVLPFDTLPPARLVLETTARVFDRPVRLLGVHRRPDPRSEPDEERLQEVRWAHADPERPAPALVLSLRSAGFERLVLEVDEGDNSPLSLERPRILLPAFRLRFFAPAGESLTLCYGNDEIAAPRYDIKLLAPRLAVAGAREARAGAETAPYGKLDRSATERRVFWTVLVAAVLVLLAVVGRLVTRHAPPAAPAGSPGDRPDSPRTEGTPSDQPGSTTGAPPDEPPA